MNGVTLREHSLADAERLGYPTNPSLPYVESPGWIRPEDDIASRALALSLVLAFAYGFSREKTQRLLERDSLEEDLTPAELSFIKGDSEVPNEEFKLRIEALWALAWALSFVDRLDFSQVCGEHLVHLIPDWKRDDEPSAFRSAAKLRDADDIQRALDLAYCLDWAVAEERLRRIQASDRVPPYVIEQRRRALEWLVLDEDWDDIILDT